MTGERRDVGPVPVSQLGGDGRPVPTTDGSIRTSGGRIDKILDSLDAVLDSVDNTDEGASPLDVAQLEEMGIGPLKHVPRRRGAAPAAGSAIIDKMTRATWGDSESDGELD